MLTTSRLVMRANRFREAGKQYHSQLSNLLPWLLLFIMTLKQFEQALAHEHSRPIRWHVFFDLPAHIYDGIGVGGFQHIPIFSDNRGIPIDQLLRGAVHLGIVAIENLN